MIGLLVYKLFVFILMVFPIAMFVWGMFQAQLASTVYMIVIGMFQAWIAICDLSGRTIPKDMEWTPEEIAAIRKYNLFFSAPHVSQKYSGALSNIQVSTFIWVPLMLYKGLWVQAIVLAVNYWIAQMFAEKLNPGYFLHYRFEVSRESAIQSEMEAVDSVCDKLTTRMMEASGSKTRDLITAPQPKATSMPPGKKQQGNHMTLTLPGGVTMEFVYIRAGTFMMGSPSHEKGRHSSEVLHQVTLTHDFWMGKTPVTQAQFQAIMGTNPSVFPSPQNPVERVSFHEVAPSEEYSVKGNFCDKISQYSGEVVRLPTEAEWEYACRAGSPTAFCFGDDVRKLRTYAWYSRNSKDRTHSVGQRRPNAWGLYDMHGNVWEWCNDWYGDYPRSCVTDPKGPTSGEDRVLRGGSWLGEPSGCRSAGREGLHTMGCSDTIGFRVVISLV